MSHSEPPSAPLTVRDVPEPLGMCDSCGGTPALPELGGRFHRCPACHARELLADAARDHFRELLAPVLGAWAHHWTAAGVAPEGLAEVLEQESGAWMYLEAGQEHRREIIRELLERHRPPAYQDTAPERVTVTLETLPVLAERREAQPDRGIPWPYFTTRNPDGSASVCPEAPGLDMLTLELPDGSAVLLPLGMGGGLDLSGSLRYAVHIPARLREQARALYRPRRRNAGGEA